MEKYHDLLAVVCLIVMSSGMLYISFYIIFILPRDRIRDKNTILLNRILKILEENNNKKEHL